MERPINPQHQVRRVCPQCGRLMDAAERGPESAFKDMRLQFGSPQPVPRRVPVWRCSDCGVDRARFIR